MESDWRKFRDMVPQLRERYLAERNARIARIFADPKKNETERFWDAEALIRKEAITLRRALDDIRRSTMWLRLSEMRAAGILKRGDLAAFSEELQNQVFYDPFEKRG